MVRVHISIRWDEKHKTWCVGCMVCPCAHRHRWFTSWIPRAELNRDVHPPPPPLRTPQHARTPILEAPCFQNGQSPLRYGGLTSCKTNRKRPELGWTLKQLFSCLATYGGSVVRLSHEYLRHTLVFFLLCYRHLRHASRRSVFFAGPQDACRTRRRLGT